MDRPARAIRPPRVVSSAKGTEPVAASISTSVRAYTSARPSRGKPLSCSGAAYRAVPTIAPTGSVQLASARARAMPKSATLAWPSSSKSKLAGLMSRWTNPRECAYASAEVTSSPTDATWEILSL